MWEGDCFSSSLPWHVGNVRGGLLLLQFTVTCGECERGINSPLVYRDKWGTWEGDCFFSSLSWHVGNVRGGIASPPVTLTCGECDRGDCFSSSLPWHVGNVTGGIASSPVYRDMWGMWVGDCFYGIENISSNCVKNIIFLENKKNEWERKKILHFLWLTIWQFHMILRKVYFLIWVKSCMD